MPDVKEGAIVLGLGCDRGTPLATLAEAIDQALGSIGAGWAQVVAMASIDLKADEGAMQQLMAERGMPVHFFTPAQLAGVEVPNPSEVVRKYTGTPSVSEAAALLVAGQVVDAVQATAAVQAASSPARPCSPVSAAARGTQQTAQTVSGGQPARSLLPPAPQSALLVEKHKLRGPDGRNATVSIAACTGWRSTT